MRILLLLNETWNDKLHPNNNMTNWFSSFPNLEIWTISGGAEKPLNSCCKHYFQVSDREMAKSIFTTKKAGRALHYDVFPQTNEDVYTRGENFIYKNRKKFSFPLMRLVRSVIWRCGKYNIKELTKFINECNPDIIFTQRLGSVKMCRLEKIVKQISKVPMVAYTGDDEYTLKKLQFSPFAWINLFWTRAWLKKMIPQYSIFYAQSKTQMLEFSSKFNVKTKFLVKCGDFQEENIRLAVNHPIKLVYAGKLYCNRWKTLGMLSKCLQEINKDQVKMVLYIYTKDFCNKRIRKCLHDGKSSFLMGAIDGDQLKRVYSECDIALHVESFDLKNRLATKYSFSTKVMDCLSSGCAVMAICDRRHAAFEYLKENDIAFTASNKQELQKMLFDIIQNDRKIIEQSQKAYSFGLKYHERSVIQKELMEDFLEVTEKGD